MIVRNVGKLTQPHLQASPERHGKLFGISFHGPFEDMRLALLRQQALSDAALFEKGIIFSL